MGKNRKGLIYIDFIIKGMNMMSVPFFLFYFFYLPISHEDQGIILILPGDIMGMAGACFIPGLWNDQNRIFLIFFFVRLFNIK